MAPKKKKPVMYEVEKIVDSREDNGYLEYCIKWKGYKSKHNSWEPASGTDCPDLVGEFERRKALEAKATSKKKPVARRSRTYVPAAAAAPKKSDPARRGRTTTPKSASRVRKERTPLRSSARIAKQNETPTSDEDSDSSETTPTSRKRPAASTSADAPSSSKKSRRDPPRSRHYADRPSTSTRVVARTRSADHSNSTTFFSTVKDLKFKVKKIKGMYGTSGQNVIVYDMNDKQHIALCKAVCKQNPDLMIDYFLGCARKQADDAAAAAAEQ